MENTGPALTHNMRFSGGPGVWLGNGRVHLLAKPWGSLISSMYLPYDESME